MGWSDRRFNASRHLPRSPIFVDAQLALFAPNFFRRTGRFSTVLTASDVCESTKKGHHAAIGKRVGAQEHHSYRAPHSNLRC